MSIREQVETGAGECAGSSRRERRDNEVMKGTKKVAGSGLREETV